MDDKPNTYLVAITVIEGRHYIWDNMNSAVIVRVGNKKKSTAVQKNTDSPFYNEYFVFEIETNLHNLLEKNIVITVIQPRTFCRKRKILGSIKLDVATVMNQKNSQFYHKWAVLASPKADICSGPTGYLKLDMTILSRGQTPKLPLHIVNDEIEGNLLTPMAFVGERQKARFIFEIYRCEHLYPKSLNFPDYVQGKNPHGDIKPSTYVVISFAGAIVNTSIRKNTPDPVFNEKLTITDLFPPLCQRIKLEIGWDGIKKSTHAIHFINLKHISNDAVEGFLPTFGPTYIYLYSKHHFEGYLGTVLLSMRTEIIDETVAASAAQKANVQHGISAINEKDTFLFEDILLFATIFEANCISKKYHDRNISFRITFGHILTYSETEAGDYPANATEALKPQKSGKNFYYLNIVEEKPCLKIRTQRYPDFRKRMYHSNILEKIAKEMKNRLLKIEALFEKYIPKFSEVIEEHLKETSDFLFSSCKKYVEIVATSYDFDYGTNLDRERIKYCLTTMNGILDKLLMLHLNKSKKIIFRNLDDMQKKIESLIEDAQPCWPDIFLWITSGNKKIGCIKIPAREIVFSAIEEEKGEYCGKIRPMLFVMEEKDVVLCKIDIFMWLGLEKFSEDCIKSIPSGFKYEGSLLRAEERHLFEGKAYIYEGEIQPGFDETGLVDPFVQVSLASEMKDTQIKKKVLVPLWDETLIFNNINIYGSMEHIKKNPPSILVQMFDQDNISKELVGRTLIKPKIFLSEDKDFNKLKLIFHYLYKQGGIFGKILAAFELTEIHQPKPVTETKIIPIPNELKPQIQSYRVEVLFWGVRNLKRVNLIRINRPKITMYCGNKYLESKVIENARKFSNFLNFTATMDVNMALQKEYPETFQFKLFDSRKFGIYVFAGISISETTSFLFQPLTNEERNSLLYEINYSSSSFNMHSVTSSEIYVDNWEKAVEKKEEEAITKKQTAAAKCCSAFTKCLKKICSRKKSSKITESKDSEYSLLSTEEIEDDYNDFDWWTKFYASSDEKPTSDSKEPIPPSHRNKLKIYPNELELQPEFKLFSDILTSFEIFKGKRTGDEILDEQLTTAIFKGAVKIYAWPPEDGDINNLVTPTGSLVKDGVFVNNPSNTPLQYVLRVYCIRGLNLRPKDLNGKSDPYLQLQFGQKIITDKENYIAKTVNPIFGRCFELQGSFPETTTLIIRVFDYDMITSDDFIGETKIDLENRYYTKHRASCGIAESYFLNGYCKWRDQKTPSEILSSICQKWGLCAPEYKENSIFIGAKKFSITPNFKSNNDPCTNRENLALEALKHWQEMPVVGFKLVPEYVETRSLFSADKPGIEQGKIQLWVDILPRTEYPVPEKVNITPRKPINYELRVIIWNTEDIILSEDDFFSGEKKSDIFVKGWIDEPKNTQYTDVHYRSLTGEGNFNWRFIYRFYYLSTENKLIIKKKESTFSREENEIKVPCILNLTVWDNDTFSADDFLGCLYLDLARMPRGARSAKKCDLSILDANAKKINLFKLRRTKGWWPFRSKDHKTKKMVLGGKLEAEFEILTTEEADQNPAGMGRQGPQSLPPPKRPDTSFTWFRNPLKSFKYVVCKTWRWQIIKGCCCIFFILFIALGFYAMPRTIIEDLMKSLQLQIKNITESLGESIRDTWKKFKNNFGDRIQHRHLLDEENSKYCYSLRNCKKSKDCKIFWIILIFVLLLATTVVLFLYFEGFISKLYPSCYKTKRETPTSQ